MWDKLQEMIKEAHDYAPFGVGYVLLAINYFSHCSKNSIKPNLSHFFLKSVLGVFIGILCGWGSRYFTDKEEVVWVGVAVGVCFGEEIFYHLKSFVKEGNINK